MEKYRGDELLKPVDFAKEVGVSTTTVYMMLREGSIKHVLKRWGSVLVKRIPYSEAERLKREAN